MMSSNTKITITGASGAAFSDDRQYRYALWRTWDISKPKVTFVCLNPSTADADKNDPTINKCIAFVKSWKGGGLIMANLFAYRATKPKEMKLYPYPVGEMNDHHLKGLVAESGLVIVAWGNHGAFKGRDKQVLSLLGDTNVHYLRKNKNGSPTHPLFLPGSLEPRPYRRTS